jgi:casein kinase II subunit alpha
LDSHYDGILQTCPKKEWKKFINTQN